MSGSRTPVSVVRKYVVQTQYGGGTVALNGCLGLRRPQRRPRQDLWDGVLVGDHVVEVHPELSFRAMAPGTSFASKKTGRGAGQRIAALSSTVDIPTALGEVPDGVGLDDALDALAAAWSAARWACGAAEVLGDERDGRGRPMRIVV